jgi:steroid delta-isomerase-like uncharacterized protein
MNQAVELAGRWFEEVWNQNREQTIRDLWHPDCQGFLEGDVEVRQPEDFINARRELLASFPDMRVIVEDIVGQGDAAVVRWRVTGTHTGHGMGISATHKAVSFRGMTWMVFSNGQLIRGWDAWNQGALLEKLRT